MAVNHYREWKVRAIQGDHADFTAEREESEWVTFHNPVEQDVTIECDQYAHRLFPWNDTCRLSEYYP